MTGEVDASYWNAKSCNDIAFCSAAGSDTTHAHSRDSSMIQCNVYRGYSWVAMSLRQVQTAFLIGLMLCAFTVSAEPKPMDWADLVPKEADRASLNIPRWERVRTDLDNKDIRIPGFIVPVEFDGKVVTRFLLVPYFGACIHEPPPPPNQTIYAEFEAGFQLESLWTPYWIEGMIIASQVEEELATASYTMTAEKIEPYSYE